MTLVACADCGKQFPEDDLAWQNGDDGYCPECMVKFNKMLADVAEFMQHPPVPNPEPEIPDPDQWDCEIDGHRWIDTCYCVACGMKQQDCG